MKFSKLRKQLSMSQHMIDPKYPDCHGDRISYKNVKIFIKNS